MSLPNSSEFQSVDGFYTPQDGGTAFTLQPVLIVGVILLLLAAGMIGWFLGRRKRAEGDPSQAIYDAIKKAVSAAAGAPRDSVAITARHLKTVLDDRLGAVRRLGHGIDGPATALDDALEGYGEAEDHKPDHDDGKADTGTLSGVRKVTINARRVVLNTHAPAEVEDKPDDQATADHGSRGHGDHGPRKRLDGRAQTAAIRAAVHEFADYWSDKPARIKDLREARRQLTTLPPPSSKSPSDGPAWEKSRSDR